MSDSGTTREHDGEYVSPSCLLFEHQCRAWKSCQCPCHNGQKLRREITARILKTRRMIEASGGKPPF